MGLMSGTSLDGVDVSIIESDGNREYSPILDRYFEYDRELTKKILKIRDKGNDLWSVFNVVQEKIIDGDFEYVAAGKVRKARQIKNFKQDQKINKELFDVALEFAS